MTNPAPQPSGLAVAVCQVMLAVRNVEKTGRNDFHRYDYASDVDLLRALQPAMAEAGLVLLPIHVDQTITEHSPDRKGKTQFRTDLVVTYRLQHTSGEHIELQAPGCGIDGEDKGAYKAMTGALKYVLRHTFLVPTGDDPERDSAPARAKRKTPAKRAPAKRKAPEPDPEPPGLDQRALSVALSKADLNPWFVGWYYATKKKQSIGSKTDQERAEILEWATNGGRRILAGAEAEERHKVAARWQQLLETLPEQLSADIDPDTLAQIWQRLYQSPTIEGAAMSHLLSEPFGLPWLDKTDPEWFERIVCEQLDAIQAEG